MKSSWTWQVLLMLGAACSMSMAACAWAASQDSAHPHGNPAASSDDDANAPYKTFDSLPAITMEPLLLDMSSTSVVVEWMTDSPADERVRYGEGHLGREIVPQQDGLIPVGTMHRVVIDGLLPGHSYQYQVSSRRVVALKPYWPDMGQTVQSPVYNFTTFDPAKKSASFAVITDTHEDVDRIRALMDMIHRAPVDFVVHDGDGVNYGVSENQLKDRFLEPMAVGLQERVPLIYARGNHEYRGEFARFLGGYLHAQDDKYYFTRDEGPLHLVVVDTGEDKSDDTNVYAGLNDLRDYRSEEFAWLKKTFAEEKRTTTAPFTVVLGHQPDWGWLDEHSDQWTQLANRAHVDLFIAGHEHVFQYIRPGERGNDFPILVVGQDQVARVQASDTELKVEVTDRTGKLVDKFSLQRKRK
jgi:predicted phosphodiesterase